MDVDLQGVKDENFGNPRYILTDPAIHCHDVTRVGRTNLGREGMHNFFSSHHCNSFCDTMELEFHKSQPRKKYT